MKNYTSTFSILLAAFFLMAAVRCTPPQSGITEAGRDSTEVAIDTSNIERTEPSVAVSIWKSAVSVRVQPGANAKWVTTVSLGERFEYLGESRTVATDDGERKWASIRLLDGQEGWILQDFILIGGQPAAVLQNQTPVYRRPDILTKSDKVFGKFDVIAVQGEGAFVEFKGMRADDTWFTSGWIKSENINVNPVDVATAVYIRRALAVEDKEERLRELQTIYNSGDFEGSYFLTDLEDMIRELD